MGGLPRVCAGLGEVIEVNSVGEYIKRERELRGFTLDEISRATKISMRYLRALEADDNRSLPAEAFVKGFLRAYAQCIGLDPHEVMLVYEQCRGKGDSLEEGHQVGPPVQGRERPQVSRKLLVASAALAACIIAIALLAVNLVDKEGPRVDDKTGSRAGGAQFVAHPPAPEPGGMDGEQAGGEDAAHTSELGGKKALSQKLTILPMRRAPQAGWNKGQRFATIREGEAGSVAPPPGENLVLKVGALTGTWVEVRIDELERYERLFLPSGDTRVWTAKDRILLTLGNVRGVELELNGRKISVPETEGNVLRNYSLTRESLR